MKGKYIICCKELVEFIMVQKFCHSIGVHWEEGNKEVIMNDSDAIWLRLDMDRYVLEGCGEPASYLANKYKHLNVRDYKFINVDCFIRRIKLERLDRSSSIGLGVNM